jgi:hypothetical protein
MPLTETGAGQPDAATDVQCLREISNARNGLFNAGQWEEQCFAFRGCCRSRFIAASNSIHARRRLTALAIRLAGDS